MPRLYRIALRFIRVTQRSVRSGCTSIHPKRLLWKVSPRKGVLVPPKQTIGTTSRWARDAAFRDERTKLTPAAVTMRAERP
jgi:hypothetical protein